MSKNKYKNSNSIKSSSNSTGNTISSIGSVMPFSKEFLFALFVFAIVLLIQPSKASAATIDVATGSASINDGDSICQLEEAIENINDGSRVYADCVESGAYGNDDTINLPGDL